MTLTRRTMLKWAAGAAAVGMVPARRSVAGEATSRIPVGLELWSVRAECERELPVVLKAIAKMGYSSVEMRIATTAMTRPPGVRCWTRTD